MEKISWTDRVRNEEVLQSVKKEMNILHKTQKTKANWIGHILHTLKTGGTEVTGKRGRRRKQLLNDLTKTRGYWKLKEEALDRTMRRGRKVHTNGYSGLFHARKLAEAWKDG
jgi:hypothetical protein